MQINERIYLTEIPLEFDVLPLIPIDPVRYPQLGLALGGNALIRPGEAGTLEEVPKSP